jgi:hypothetical protein
MSRKPHFPVTIYVNHNALVEFEASEWGSYQDATSNGTASAHVVPILQRHTNKIVVANEEEARTVYVAACSGTFQQEKPTYHAVAVRICNRLREFCTPADLKLWPHPAGI